MQPNRRLGDDIICGPFFLVGDDHAGSFCSLTEEQIQRYTQVFQEPEQFTGQEQELEENVLALLQEYDMVDECIIGSMNRGILQRVKELEPDISTVYIAHDLGEDDYDLDYADSYSIEGKNLTADMVEAIHYEGKSVYGWTANTSGAMRQIVNSGADGIVTDDVRLLQAFLRENACRKAFESVY